jgi:fatty acid desaturase
MNDAVYRLASFMMMKDPTVWRWSHTRHHTDTLILGRDPEIVAMRPARLAKIIANLVGLYDVPVAFRDMALHAAGRVTAEEATFIPASERSKVYRTARIWLASYAAVATACVLTGSILPAMVIGLPRMYGACMLYVYSLTQHAGLGENVLDHRLNTRTVSMCRLNRFLYWNMNYHVEHHMFPMVPYHRLPELHTQIAHDLAAPYPSIWAVHKEVIPAILRQLKDPTYYVRRELPPAAAPFHPKSDGRALELVD